MVGPVNVQTSADLCSGASHERAVSPPPVTVDVWPGREDTKATSSSPAANVLKGAVVTVPDPSAETFTSICREPAG